MKADLHCHSRISDGSMEIRDIVALAKRIGINTLGIADHDTVEGLEQAKRAGLEFGVDIVSSIEISAYDYKRKQKAHILGFLIDKPEQVAEICKPILIQRQQNSKSIIEILESAGYPITWEFTESIACGSTNVYKQHIMHALMHLGYASAIHDVLYQELFAKPRNGNPGGIAYREIDYIDVYSAVRAIKQAGGIAVLAHPVGYNNLELVPQLIEIGLDGLEAWHPSHNGADIRLIIGLAKKYGLILTGGSDFHGMYEGKPNSLGNCYMPEEWLDRLYECKIRWGQIS